MCQVSSNKEVVVSTYHSLYKNSPQTLENCTSIVSSSYTFPDKDPHTYPSLTFAFSVGADVVWVYGVDEAYIRDSDLLAANYALANCGGGGGGNVVDETNVKEINTPTYTLLTTDYILYFTVNCVVTLPTITAPLVAFPFRMFARGVRVDFNRSGGDLINNRTSFTIRRYQQVTIRALRLLDWGAGD
jgi:hypothetical protein